MHVSSYCLHFTLRGLIFRSDSLQRQNRFACRAQPPEWKLQLELAVSLPKAWGAGTGVGQAPPRPALGAALGPLSSVQGWVLPLLPAHPKGLWLRSCWAGPARC